MTSPEMLRATSGSRSGDLSNFPEREIQVSAWTDLSILGREAFSRFFARKSQPLPVACTSLLSQGTTQVGSSCKAYATSLPQRRDD